MPTTLDVRVKIYMYRIFGTKFLTTSFALIEAY